MIGLLNNPNNYFMLGLSKYNIISYILMVIILLVIIFDMLRKLSNQSNSIKNRDDLQVL